MMKTLLPLIVAILLFAPFTHAQANSHSAQSEFLKSAKIKTTDWPWWRGPHMNGIADPNQNPPIHFNQNKNVRWIANIPGKGHGSPIVVNDFIFLATADDNEQTQSILCLDRESGKQNWISHVHKGNFPKKTNRKASHASPTPAFDGKNIYINFMNNGAVYTSALNLEGKVLWQTRITDYVIHQGYAASPAIYKNLVITAADNKTGGAVSGLNRDNGKIVWTINRPKMPNYVSPIIFNIAGRDQLILTGCELVSSYDPANGKKIWEIKGSTTECVTSTVTDGKHIITSGGYPTNHVSAVTADGSNKIVWKNTSRVYVPSLLINNGYLYGIMDAGVAVCWEAATGKVMWKERLGGTFSASPVMVGNRIYAANESGEIFVFNSDPHNFKILAKNKLADQIFATPTICNGQIIQRVIVYKDNTRLEKLYCIAISNL